MGEQGGGQDCGGARKLRRKRRGPAEEIEDKIRAKLSALPLTARGMWHEVRYLIENNTDRPGHLQQDGSPILDEQLAILAGCDSGTCSSLLRVLTAPTCMLLSLTDAGVYHAPLLAKLNACRERNALRTERWRKSRSAGGGPSRARTVTRLSAHSDAGVRDSPAPLPVSPSHSPSNPPPAPGAAGAAPSPAAARSAEGEARKRGKATKPKEPPAEFRQLTDHWCARWAEAHEGLRFNFQREDGVHLAKVFDRCGRCLADAIAAADAYLADKRYRDEGHPTYYLRRYVDRYRQEVLVGGNGARYGTAKPTAADRGEFPESITVRILEPTPGEGLGVGGSNGAATPARAGVA